MNLEDLVIEAQGGSEAAFQEVCERFVGLVKKLAYQPHIRPIGEEAIAIGLLTVVESVKNYNDTVGVPFAGYVQSRLKFTMWNLFKRERRRWQSECTVEAEQGEDFTILDQLAGDTNIEDEVEQKLLAGELLKQMEKLPIKQRQAVLFTLLCGKGLTETGKILHITPQGVFNLRNRGIEKLRRTMQLTE